MYVYITWRFVITVAPSADQKVAKTNSSHLLTSGHCNLFSGDAD